MHQEHKNTITQNKRNKLNPGLVASYDIWPGNREGLFLFWHFINLSLTYTLTLRFSFFSTKPRVWPGGTSPKLPVLCCVGRNTLTRYSLCRYSKNNVQLLVVELRRDPAEWNVDTLRSFTWRRLHDADADQSETESWFTRQTAHQHRLKRQPATTVTLTCTKRHGEGIH